VKWKEAKAALAKQGPDPGRKSAATRHPATPKSQRARPSAELMALGEGLNHFVRENRVVKATTPSPFIANPPSQPVTESSEQPSVTATRKTTRPQKSEHKTTADPKSAVGKSKKKAAAIVKTAAGKPTTSNLLVSNQNFHLPTR